MQTVKQHYTAYKILHVLRLVGAQFATNLTTLLASWVLTQGSTGHQGTLGLREKERERINFIESLQTEGYSNMGAELP